eukprot:gnl/TRDRNA2_/TRDRNA2_130222_c0_seq1.p1 gnl/TRDRNA2_/TRDRNA2_130222_c0~~gnl/TRDRNA2_/TRDRNA2_130222_c0_seq1.p1  ORF type:complete len:183 (+),score=32.30 gnl/TRDRNA2_/TRDRNA2_130222_c0_seq1:25-573(+)
MGLTRPVTLFLVPIVFELNSAAVESYKSASEAHSCDDGTAFLRVQIRRQELESRPRAMQRSSNETAFNANLMRDGIQLELDELARSTNDSVVQLYRGSKEEVKDAADAAGRFIRRAADAVRDRAVFSYSVINQYGYINYVEDMCDSSIRDVKSKYTGQLLEEEKFFSVSTGPGAHKHVHAPD